MAAMLPTNNEEFHGGGWTENTNTSDMLIKITPLLPSMWSKYADCIHVCVWKKITWDQIFTSTMDCKIIHVASVLIILAFDGGKWSASCPCNFCPGTHWAGSCVLTPDPIWALWKRENAPTGNRTLVTQPNGLWFKQQIGSIVNNIGQNVYILHRLWYKELMANLQINTWKNNWLKLFTQHGAVENWLLLFAIPVTHQIPLSFRSSHFCRRWVSTKSSGKTMITVHKATSFLITPIDFVTVLIVYTFPSN
jgi:hypothetical protein